MIEWDDRELHALATDLGKVGATAQKGVRAALSAGSEALARQWRSNARKTAGTHGRLYPRSITAEQKFSTDMSFEVGPETRMPQGGMGPGFEFGSVNQPPHLDGQQAADKVIPRIEADIADVMAGIAVSTDPGSDLIEYTTKAGVTRMATEAQVANWTRGSR